MQTVALYSLPYQLLSGRLLSGPSERDITVQYIAI